MQRIVSFLAAACLVACADGSGAPAGGTNAGDAAPPGSASASPSPPPNPPPPPPPAPGPMPATWAVDAVACSTPAVSDHCNTPITDATFALKIGGTYTPPAVLRASDGYAMWQVPSTLLSTDVKITAPGFAAIDAPIDVLHTHDGLSHNIITLEPQLPPVPTRDQVLSVKLTFQGLSVTLPTYGTVPWFEPAISSLDAASRQAVYQAKHAAGDTHIIIAISWAYQNDGGYSYPVPGTDLTGNLAGFRALVTEAIQNGFTPILFLAGDGESPAGGGYDDPNGWTYGYGWLSTNLPSIVAALQQPFDLTPYCLLVPGWDGVMPGWQPSELDAYLLQARALLPNGYLGVELAAGYCHWGGGATNYSSPSGQALDAVLQEFPGPPTGDQVWQIAARELGPSYVRPPDEPPGDDPSPPYYLSGGTPRGAWYAVGFEFDEYRWVRGLVTGAELTQERQYLTGVGYRFVD